ncbi:BadF/BadG/BcrA/BcrD ATPase family protein [Streptomyces sp. BPTC-684]|uniref:N-acetylglucosamine kinase n=1 Tax=Streptomyces sp. BPTC-684 TaxID=3043734 RepID=UPI0024B1DD3E|nr:BadF/BadG/BcrA/BcrD ATPase family protein [Streptomyces sp. BPTC-684]WHM39959.1 BadF/BadG/BcrA/BcrD ATPase family protein [Streptomyces sp. BPTC-684]
MTVGGDAWVLGVDSGGSGVRFALGRAEAGAPAEVLASDEPVRTGPAGIDAGHLLGQLVPAAQELLARTGADRVAAVAVGAAGMASLGDDLRAKLPAALAGALGVRRLALAADGVTAYAGALGQRPGAVVAAGTGMIALGTDLTRWRRADGWGHLLGDCGGGAWIGRAGLEAAMRAHDGRRGGSAALRERAEALFGPAAELPGLLYPRTDRPAVLASFAPEVARCAAFDPIAASILREAARNIAESAAAVCPEAGPADGHSAHGTVNESVSECEVALTGGLFHIGDALLVPVRQELASLAPHARTVPAAGDPLAGALLIASALAREELRLPHHPRMLRVTTERDG